MKTIKTNQENLILCELSLKDARAYFELLEQNRDHMNKFGTMTETRYASVKEVASDILHPLKPKKQRFAVWNEDTLVGLVSLIDKGNKRCEIGGWIGQQYIRRGFAASALRALALYAKKSGYTRTIATTYPNNIPSQQMLQKIGFTRTHRLKNRHYFAFQK